LAVVVPMVTAEELVGTPALQFPDVFQLLSPAVPVHESAVRGGGALRVARRTAAALATGCCLSSECCESLRFDPSDCAEAEPSKLERTARRQSAIVHRVTTRRDAGRMADSERKISCSANLFVAQCTRPKDLSMAVGRGVYTIPSLMSSRISQEF